MRGLISILLAIAPAAAADLHVGAGRAHSTLASAIAAAAEGDTIRVHPGIYRETGLRIAKSLKLSGAGFPIIDAGKQGDVLTIAASDVSITGFEIRGSGTGSLDDLAGIKVRGAERVSISGNRVRDCHFGIYLAKSKDCHIQDNEVSGTPGGEQDTGNAIHLWYCDRITVGNNQVSGHRDGIYLEFAGESTIEENTVENCLRYGLHYMFSHQSVYRRNSFRKNGAGVAVMYSRNVDMSENVFGDNWGAAAYGLLLKDMSDGSVSGNTFERNTIGIAMHGSNRMTLENNRFESNGWAVQVQSSSSDNTFRRNNFAGNSFDVAADGELDNNRFEHNHWDKYEGYDLKRDGSGDVPYRPVSLYAVVVSRVPSSVLLLRSPIVHLLDQAEKAFPSITPETVMDETPAMRPHPLPRFQPTPNPP